MIDPRLFPPIGTDAPRPSSRTIAGLADLLPVPTGDLRIGPVPKHWPLRISLIIPTYNEAANLAPLVQALCPLLDAAYPQQYELIVVDDDSPDRTWAHALTLSAEYPQLRVMRRVSERGLSTAVIRGWQAAQGEILGVIDGDLQHPPAVLLGLLAALENGADLAVASRHVAGGGISDWGLGRRLLSRGAQLLGLVILPSVVGRVSDPMSGYFAVRRSAISGVLLNPKGYKILLEVLGRGQVGPIAEVGYVFQERRSGASKVTARQYVDYLHHLWTLRGRRVRAIETPIGDHANVDRDALLVGRFLRFGLVGLSGVVIDMALFYLLSDSSTLDWGLTTSKILASELAIVNNFWWNDRWTFGDLARTQRGWPKRLKRFLKFNAICLMGLTLNVVILNVLFNAFGVNRYVANFVAIGLVTFWNFWINLKLSWRVTDVK
jgi:dolichol-phosphate mannosyltransferase